MDLVRDRTSNVAEEDRISKLPDDIIHRILSFLDMKYAVQTSKLSKRWKFIWTSMPELNLNFQTFGGMHEFAKFVKPAISHRNHSTQVSAVKLTFRGLPTGFVVNRVIDYTYIRNIRQLTIIWFPKNVPEFPLSIFRSHTLKHLTLKTNHEGRYSELACVPTSAWDLPSLETLNLSNLYFNGNTDKNLNLFPKCVNLKELTLHKCLIYHVDVFNIRAPQLSNLTITQPRSFAKAFNVVAPQLKNLTASIIYEYFDTSILSSEHLRTMQLSTEGLDSLEKVNLLIPRRSKHCVKNIISTLLDLFQKLRSAKVLIINLVIVEVLSLYLDQDLHEPCPFNNLKCLKIDDILPLSLQDHEKNRITKMVSQIRNYFLENSPTATVIDLIPVSPVRVKRPRGLVDNHATANKVAKLVVEENKPETMAEETRILEAKIQTANKVAKLAVEEYKPETMAEETRNLETKIQTANKVAKLAVEENKPETMAEETRNLEAKIQMLEQVNAKQKDMFVAKIQMQDEVIAEQKTKVQMQDEVIAAQKAKI